MTGLTYEAEKQYKIRKETNSNHDIQKNFNLLFRKQNCY